MKLAVFSLVLFDKFGGMLLNLGLVLLFLFEGIVLEIVETLENSFAKTLNLRIEIILKVTNQILEF